MLRDVLKMSDGLKSYVRPSTDVLAEDLDRLVADRLLKSPILLVLVKLLL